MAYVTLVMEHWLEQEIAQWIHNEESIQQPIAPWVDGITTELHLTPTKKKKKKKVYEKNQ